MCLYVFSPTLALCLERQVLDKLQFILTPNTPKRVSFKLAQHNESAPYTLWIGSVINKNNDDILP